MAIRLILLAAALWLSACSPQPEPDSVLADDMEAFLQEGMLDVWYPLVIDSLHGGYLSDFDAKWQQTDDQRKMIVSQARHVWTLSKAAERYPDRPEYLEMAQHGVAFLRDVMWDDAYGGFYTMVDRAGDPIQAGSLTSKTAYGNAFAVYGLAAYVAASDDSSTKEMVEKAFQWLETHSYDPVDKGYFQHMERDGTPLREGNGRTPAKDQNSSIHLLEAFTELYHAWPDSLVGTRLEEMLYLIRDVMVQDERYLGLFFEADWEHVSYQDSSAEAREANQFLDYVSFGHDVETAFLMLEAAEALHLPVDTTLRIGKQMVDHAIQFGWDAENGGIIDEAYYFAGDATPTVIKNTKTWWAQAEALNAWWLFHTLYPDDPIDYRSYFDQQWAYIDEYLLDHEHGGWYSSGLDRVPEAPSSRKAQIWKTPYHTARALMRCVDGLRKH